MFQGAKVRKNFRSREQKGRPFRSRERKFQGANSPKSELARVLLADSLLGANGPRSEKAVNPGLAGDIDPVTVNIANGLLFRPPEI